MRKASGPVAEAGGRAEHIDDFSISRRYRGPPESGNGGYTCGRLAEYLEGPATVRLTKPPPLDIQLNVVRQGAEVQLRSGDQVIARAWPSSPQLEAPASPGLESARQRSAYFAGHGRHAFPGCFVCGVDRKEGDGLRIHAGPEAPGDGGRHHVACTWTPQPTLCGEDGVLPQRYVWSALDCPGGWSFLSFADEVALLGEMSAEILAPLHCGREYIVAGWEISREGRKRRTGSALYSEDGTPVARALATWITVSQ